MKEAAKRCTKSAWPVGPDAKSKPKLAHVAQLVERVLGKDEVTSSILVVGSSAGVTQWLESRPSKPLVAGSNPVSRSFCNRGFHAGKSGDSIHGQREIRAK